MTKPDWGLRGIFSQHPNQKRPCDNTQTLAQIGLRTDWFKFIVASSADDKCKSHIAVAEAVQTINARSPNAQVILLGDGKHVNIINSWKRRGELPNVHCAGQAASAQEWMDLSDCHVLATYCAEKSLPVCIGDAHFERIPTISWDIGYIKDTMKGAGIILNLNHGRLNTTVLIAAMKMTMDSRNLPNTNPESYSSMQSKCSKLYNRNHKLSVMTYFRQYLFAVPPAPAEPST